MKTLKLLSLALGLAIYVPVLAASTTTIPDSAKADFAKGTTVFAPAWVLSTAYTVGDRVRNDTAPIKVYECITAGTSAASGGPTGTTADITDNTAHWKYIESAPTMKVAMYTSTATNGAATTIYSATNEVTGTAYTAGGATVSGCTAAISANHANVTCDTTTWGTATISNAASALLYTSTKGDRAVAVWDFGGNYTSTAGDFSLDYPAAAIQFALDDGWMVTPNGALVLLDDAPLGAVYAGLLRPTITYPVN
jgi:hypothetical protein